MSKYIDAEKLIAEIEKLLAKAEKDEKKAFVTKDAACHLAAVTKTAVCVKIKKFISILQQERPEVDLEKEMQEEYYKYAIYESGSISGEGYQLEAQGHHECCLTRKEFNDIARHFYELGLNARKEE